MFISLPIYVRRMAKSDKIQCITMSFVSISPEFSDDLVDFFHLHVMVIHYSPRKIGNYAIGYTKTQTKMYLMKILK